MPTNDSMLKAEEVFNEIPSYNSYSQREKAIRLIAETIDKERDEAYEAAAHVAEAHIAIRWDGPERREKSLGKVIAKAIRTLSQGKK